MSPAASKENTGQEAGEKAKKKGGKGKIIILVAIVLILAIAGAAVWFFLLADRGEELSEPEPQVKFYSPELKFTVNLAESEHRRFLRTTLVLGYQEARLTEELVLKEAQIRDLIITILRARSKEDISTREGVQNLRLEIKEALNDFLEESPVLEVFFTEFVVQ